MTEYDERIFQEFADRLYRRAARVTLKYLTVGAGLGALIPYTAVMLGGYFRDNRGVSPDVVGALIYAILFGFIGASIGASKAFAYKLQAQTTLCQMHIERNTRRATEQSRGA